MVGFCAMIVYLAAVLNSPIPSNSLSVVSLGFSLSFVAIDLVNFSISS